MLSPESNGTDNQKDSAGGKLAGIMFATIFDAYGFEPPASNEANADNEETLNFIQQYAENFKVFQVIIMYFFVCGGLVLIGIGIFAWLRYVLCLDPTIKPTPPNNTFHSLLEGEAKQNKLRFLRIGSCLVFGTGTALLATIVLTPNANILGQTAWTIAILAFVYLLVLALDQIPKRQREVSHVEPRRKNTFIGNKA